MDTGLVTWAALILVAGLGIVFQRRHSTVDQRFARDQAEALRAAAAEDWRRVDELYAALHKKYRAHAVSVWAVYARVNALLRLGDYEGALAVALESEANDAVYPAVMRATGAAQLGKLYTLRGETALAAKWLATAKARFTKTAGWEEQSAKTVSFVEVALLCREERFAETLALLDRERQRFENGLSLPQVAETWLWRAFATSQLASPRDVGALESILPMLRMRPRGSFDWLALEWPALRSFLVVNGLSSSDSQLT